MSVPNIGRAPSLRRRIVRYTRNMDRAKLSPSYVLTHRERILPYLRYRFPRLSAPFFLGKRHRCSLCGVPLRRFAGFFASSVADCRVEGVCPFCGSLSRTRQLDWWLSRTGLLNPGARVLHVAPENALLQKLRQTTLCDVTTFDLAREDVDVRGNLERMPFDASRFDVIICSHVLEHVCDDAAAMREMCRVLKPGGVALVMVPLTSKPTEEDPSVTSAAERAKRFGLEDHLRIYGPDIVERLDAAGFVVEVLQLPEALKLPDASAHFMGMGVHDTLFVARARER